jgi:hypothetical protein
MQRSKPPATVADVAVERAAESPHGKSITHQLIRLLVRDPILDRNVSMVVEGLQLRL